MESAESDHDDHRRGENAKQQKLEHERHAQIHMLQTVVLLEMEPNVIGR